MKVYNAEVAKKFTQMADLLEIESANPFRIRAYRNAARIIESLPENVADLVEKNTDLTQLPYIGEDLSKKIIQIVQTGELPALKEIEKRTSPVLSQLMEIEGLGPKRVKLLYLKLKIKSMEDLKKAIEKNKLSTLRGFGEKLTQKIKQSIEYSSEYAHRFKLIDAMVIAERLLNYLKTIPGIKHVEVAGSYRRRKDTVGDLDFLVVTQQPEKITKQFIEYDEVREILAQGATKASVRLSSGMQVDVRMVPIESYGAALLYFTGSKAHNIAIRKLALQKGLKINEYGVFKKNKKILGRTEKEIYQYFKMAYVEPELREDSGEIEAAMSDKLPKLVTLENLRGDLHTHTNATDGADSLEAMVRAAQALGHEYIAITNHSYHLRVVSGLDRKAVFAQIKAIDKLQKKYPKITILKSIELDILEDGKLDLSEDVLKELDLCVCSIHSSFELSQKIQTERIIRAMDNRYFNILAHPSGRLIGQRAAYEIDLDRVMDEAKVRGCFLEINAQPSRLDLNETAAKLAKQKQLKMVISSDAHSTHQLAYLKFGVYQARRGWLEASDVINTRPLAQLKKLLKRP